MSASFFQSPLWRQLQFFFDREVLDYSLGDETFWGVTRRKKVGPLSFSRNQLLGFPLSTLEDLDGVLPSVLRHVGEWGHTFVQLGCDTVFWSGSVEDAKNDTLQQEVLGMRSSWNNKLAVYGYQQSRRENMPLATIVTPLVSQEELLQGMHKSHRNLMRKAAKSGFSFVKAQRAHRDDFYDLWVKLSVQKEIGIMSHPHYLLMMDYLEKTGSGALFIVLDGDVIVSGSICVRYAPDGQKKDMFYLYGASNRDYGNSGAHVWLQYSLMLWGLDQGYASFDHRGVAPLGAEHHLVGVTRFKERFGGIRKEFVGNVDYVYQPLLYRLMKLRHSF